MRVPADTLRNNDVVITSKRRNFDIITSKWRRYNDVITTPCVQWGGDDDNTGDDDEYDNENGDNIYLPIRLETVTR